MVEFEVYEDVEDYKGIYFVYNCVGEGYVEEFLVEEFSKVYDYWC